jgi:hypothetical protein
MNEAAQWANHHDWVKLGLFALLMFPVFFVAGVASGTPLFWVTVLLGVALCGVFAYWVGNPRWLFIPLLAMLVFIALAIPMVTQDPGTGETPFSIVLESPFWAGMPALIGAVVGYLVYMRRHTVRRPQS